MTRTDCYCGNSFGKFGQTQPCNSSCSGNQSQICGDVLKNSIHAILCKLILAYIKISISFISAHLCPENFFANFF